MFYLVRSTDFTVRLLSILAAHPLPNLLYLSFGNMFRMMICFATAFASPKPQHALSDLVYAANFLLKAFLI
jgi:hypothetical protein